MPVQSKYPTGTRISPKEMMDELSTPKKALPATPSMDQLANIAKYEYERQRGNFNRPSILPNSGNYRQEEFINWWNNLVKDYQINQEALTRSKEALDMEKELGLRPLTSMMSGKPSSDLDEAIIGAEQGGTGIGQLMAGLGSVVGVPGSEIRRKMYKERADVMSDYRGRRNPGITVGDVANKAIIMLPEVYNPVNKPGLAAKSANAIWQAIRGYLPNKSLEDAAVSAGSSVLGEKAEDLATKGKGFIGNTVGASLEEAYNRLFK